MCAEKIKSAKLEYEIELAKSLKLHYMVLAFKPNIDDLRESPAKYITPKSYVRI